MNINVDSLRSLNDHEWDDDIMIDIFEERDRHFIRNIPLFVCEVADNLIWKGRRKGSLLSRAAITC